MYLSRGVLKTQVVILLIRLAGIYFFRLFQVESNRQYSQDGFIRVFLEVLDLEKRPVLWANGIGCAYWLRLKNCIGVEILGSLEPDDLTNKISSMVNNFCSLVESSYPKEKYIFQSGHMAKEHDLRLGHAYHTFFDCNKSRKAIGEIRIYINPSRNPTERAGFILDPTLVRVYPR